MNIVFYSSNSNTFSPSDICTTNIPSCSDSWENLAKLFPNDNFFVWTQLPGMFLLDIDENGNAIQNEKVKYIISEKEKNEDIAEEILSLKPDLAIASSFYVTPYDWLPVKDALIAEILCAHGVKTVCNSAKTGLTCFDKNLTQLFLEKNEFNVPKSLYIHHELFWCERGHREVKSNVYKEYILNEIKSLPLPVIAKDTVGFSSYGMEVLPTYKSVAAYLLSHKNSSDRIVQEYISGLHFGTEIYGRAKNYTVFPPFIFSLNQFGITSPKQSVKIGPVTNEKYHIKQLEEDLLRLANLLEIEGSVQVDLVFSDGKWFIIEINPRLSGMSQLYAAAKNKSLYSMMAENAMQTDESVIKDDFKYVCNFKLPILNDETLKKLKGIPCIKYIRQIHNKAAKQKRETGYCEIIFGGTQNIQDLMAQLEEIAEKNPDLVEKTFLENARRLAQEIN